MPGGETTNFISGDDDCSDGSAIAEHRNCENASPLTGHRNFARVLPISEHVLNLRHLTGENCPTRGLIRLRGSRIHPPKDFDRLQRKIVVGDDMYQPAIEPMHRAQMRVAETHSVDDDRVEYRLQVESRTAEDFENFGSGRLLLSRLVELMRAAIELLLQFGCRCWCGQRFTSLGPMVLALHRLSATTASLHVAPGRFTTMLNPMQILAFAPWQDVRFGSSEDVVVSRIDVRFTPKADMCGATRDVRYGPKADIPRLPRRQGGEGTLLPKSRLTLRQ